jgi:hypothetical protein
MQPFVHLARHAPRAKGEKLAVVKVIGPGEVFYKKKRFNLRTGQAGAAFPGFVPAPDGVALAWVDKRVEALHPDGQRVRIEAPLRIDPTFAGPSNFICVGPWVVGSVAAAAPWRVFDLRTGADCGSLEGQRQSPGMPIPMVVPQAMRARDGLVWMSDLDRVVAFDPATRRCVAELLVPADHWLLTMALLGDLVVGNLRPIASHQRFSRSDDRLVALGPDGVIRWELKRETMDVEAVGDRLVVSAPVEKELLVLDAAGAQLQTLPFVEPNTKSPYATIIALPGGREFLTVGGNSEWDHWGEADLAPKA